jgi:hypothetical protein
MLIAMLAFFPLFFYLQTSSIFHALVIFLLYVMLVVVPKFQSVGSRSNGSQLNVDSWYHTGLSSNGIK